MRIATARDVGLLIRKRRNALGLDQAEVADRVGVSRQWIVAIEAGRPRAQLDLVLRALKVLDIHLDARFPGSAKASSDGERGRTSSEIDLDALLAAHRDDTPGRTGRP